MTTKNSVKAMAFYHQDGFVAAWLQAMRFAGKDGRIATMPDVIESRLATKPGDKPWETYYTTLTAEYFGYNKDWNETVIVAHGIGPMSTLDGIQKAYSWQYKDKSRNRRGGRITQQEFLDLESGKYGPVEIVDFATYRRRYEFPLIQILKASEALTDPLLKARYGVHHEDYVKHHAAAARAWHREQAGLDPENKYNFPEKDHQDFLDNRRELHTYMGGENSDPYIIKVEASNYLYGEIEDGYAYAHLISTGGLCHVHHEGNESLVLNSDCHGWNDGTRLIGIQKDADVRIYSGPDAHQLMRRHWKELFQPVTESGTPGFYRLVTLANQYFTRYPKSGNEMDNNDPEYKVIRMNKIGEPVMFKTEITGYHMFFRYDMNDVKALAPPTANAYEFVGDSQIEWNEGDPTHHVAMVQFYRVEVDTSKRLILCDQLARDYDKMMMLMNKK